MAHTHRGWFSYSLREHIAAATAMITIVLSLGISYIASSISKEQIEQREGSAFASHAHHTAEMLDRGMFERYREMQVASVLSDINNPRISNDSKRKVLERMQKSFNAYAWIGICDANGKGMVGTGKYLEGKDLSHRPWCTEGRKKPYVGDVHDALLLAKILPNPSGQKFYLLDVAAPIHTSDGTLLGVLCGHILWDWAKEMLSVSSNALTDTLLVSRDGLILAGPLTARSQLKDMAPQTMVAIQNQHSGFFLEQWSDGKTYLTGFARGSGYQDYPGLGWISLYRQDVEIAFGPARDLQNRILFAGLTLGLIFVIIGWIQAGRIAKPIQAITNAAKKVAQGNFAYTPPTIHADREVEELAESIQQMTEAMSNEIMERKCAEGKVRKISEAIYQAGEAVIITDHQGVIEYINPACSAITGYSAEEMIGKTPAILKSDEQDPDFYKQLWQAIAEGHVWHGTLIDKRKDGTLYPALMSVAPIRDDSGEITHFVSIQQDMTEQKKLEEQFMQSQKMEALGTLVGGIAHDFNNMLAGINGNLFLANKQLSSDQEELKEKLHQIETLSMRAGEMIQQMMAFARKGRVNKSVIDICWQLKDVTKLLQSTIPESTRIILELEDSKLQIWGDETQLHQLILNLVNNAQQALTDRSDPAITIGLESIENDLNFQISHPELSSRRLVHLYVRDNGHGISKENLSRVTEPFFTTKDVGKGTGLGLPMVFGAVQAHGGIMELESKEGLGTTVHIYLPLQSNDESIPIERENNGEIIYGHGENILLVDDDKTLRNVMCESLESLGYYIDLASDGKEALQIYSEKTTQIALVLMDIVMPVMSGVEAAQEILKINPEAKLVFLSGYDREEISTTSNAILDSYEVISKPVSIEKLSVLLAEKIK